MAQAGKNKQSDDPPARRNRTEPVGQGSGGIAAAAFAKKGFVDPTLILRWAEIAGTDVARIARPLRLTEGAGGGTLTLKTEPGASVFLQHETRSLCERINAYLGRQAVSRLRFVQGELAAPASVPRSLPKPGGVAQNDPALRFRGSDALTAALLALARWRGRNTSAD